MNSEPNFANRGEESPRRYVLEIFAPETTYDPIARFESQQPFLSIHAGEFIKTSPWNLDALEGVTLRVLSVEHTIIAGPVLIHMVSVYTEGIEDKSENRLLKG